jgi:hypothetical protein
MNDLELDRPDAVHAGNQTEFPHGEALEGSGVPGAPEGLRDPSLAAATAAILKIRLREPNIRGRIMP